MIGIFNNGKDIPAVGSAIGIERLLIVLENQEKKIDDDRLDVFIIAFDSTEKYVLDIMQKLRAKGISCDYSFSSKNIKNQFKVANKIGAKYAVIVGEEEIKRGVVKIKNLDIAEERESSIENIELF